MAEIVLVVQKSKAQKQIWEKLLASQGLISISESPQADFGKLLMRASASEETFPRLMILEMSIDQVNPYEFCRWVEENYPSLKVILTTEERTSISDIERRWARNQGACELLEGFDYRDLSSSLTSAMETIMAALGKTDWEEGDLVPVIEELVAEFGQTEEENTLIQESETLIQNSSEKDNQEMVTIGKRGSTSIRGVKVKPKVKRFRGLPY
jgi:CheY-like chemotaxis protein